mgnify:CR=1 FL=1
MTKYSKRKKIVLILILLFLTTGCTKTLTDKDNKAVKNEVTGQTLTKNILCKPTNKTTSNIYKKYKVNIDKLPECKDFKITSGKYEGLWNSFFVKPLAYILIQLGKFIGNYGISVITISLLIRLIAFPITKKTAMQSEILKKAQPELNRIQKKYENKQDQESMIKQNQEMMAIYKKYNIKPLSGCLFSFIQLPLFVAFLEAINRVPAIFEEKFLLFHLGTSPMIGIKGGNYWYILIIIIVGITTYFSFKLNSGASAGGNNEAMKKQTDMMMNTFLVMIVIMSIFMTSALGIYWITSNLFTIVQNLIVKRSVKNEKV